MIELGLVALLASPLPLVAPDASEPSAIVGGETVAPGAWPSVVAIHIAGYICTGTLVTDRLVMTAAHCLEDGPSLAQLSVVVGDDVYSKIQQTIDVVAYGLHPEYCGSDPEVCKADVWDYAYVELAEPVVGVEPTRPLTRQEEWDEAMYRGSRVTLVGFGRSEKDLTGIKREVEADIVGFTPLTLEFMAGGGGADTCLGDSGGPAFFTLASGEVVLAGVTSRGHTECGKGGYYGIPYAALCWLNEETGVDLRTDACGTCDCLDLDTSDDDGCGCAASDPVGPLGLAVLVLLGGLRRPGARRSRRSRP